LGWWTTFWQLVGIFAPCTTSQLSKCATFLSFVFLIFNSGLSLSERNSVKCRTLQIHNES
jgi:hypothetical protein